MSEKINRYLVGSVVPRIFYHLNIPKETNEKAREIKQFINDDKRVNLIVYLNHVSKLDPILVALVYNKIDPWHSRNLIAPVSFSNTDEKHKSNRLMIKIVESCGVETIRIVQSYQVDKEYGRKQANETSRESLTSLREIIKRDKAIGFIISPEGHRSDDGTLGEANNGFVHVGRILEPVLYIPIGIVFDEKPDREKWNLGKRVTLTLGETYLQEKGDRTVTLNKLMNNLADALPVRLRGKYQGN